MDGMIPGAVAGLGGVTAALAAQAVRVDRDGVLPLEGLAALRERGLLGLTARVQDGGGEIGLAAAVPLVQAAGRGCASTALIFSMQLIHQRALSRSPAAEAVKALVGHGAVRDGALINALMVEPALGTPSRGGLPETVARRDGDGWALSGRKIYSTGAGVLRWMLVFARTEEDTPRIGQFLVPADAPGVRVEPSWDQMGLRGSGSDDVVMEGVRVPGEYLVDLRPPAGWRQREVSQAAWGGLLIGALYTGVAEAARDWTAGFLRERVPSALGAPLASLPRMQEAMGQVEALLLANRRLLAGAAAETDAGQPPDGTESGLLKTVLAENAGAAVAALMRLTGNHGLSRANPLERHLRDVSCASVHTPQPDFAYVAAGRAALGQ